MSAPKKLYIKTYGCQMNVYDSERMAEALGGKGYVQTDTPGDAARAREFGAEGIGLCRTEHMFFDEERILAMREMICSEDEAGRRQALGRILPMQRRDFEDLFRIMDGRPATIRPSSGVWPVCVCWAR